MCDFTWQKGTLRMGLSEGTWDGEITLDYSGDNHRESGGSGSEM